jgi:hypothetical protein
MKTSMAVNVAKFLVITLFWSVPVSRAQEKPEPKQPSETQEKAITPYRLDFTITEIEDGKRINARQYSLNVNTGDHDDLKIGTRVPVEVKQGEMQYLDLGTNISADLRERDNGLALEVRAQMSNFATPENQAKPGNSMPLLREMRINASTVLSPGRPTIVGSVDDPNSKRQFQLEVTATKLK